MGSTTSAVIRSSCSSRDGGGIGLSAAVRVSAGADESDRPNAASGVGGHQVGHLLEEVLAILMAAIDKKTGSY